MKKETKKLTLSRETLRNLEDLQLREVAGGNSIQLSCDTISWHCGTMKSNCC